MEKGDIEEEEQLVEQKLDDVRHVRHTQLHIVKAHPVTQVLIYVFWGENVFHKVSLSKMTISF